MLPKIIETNRIFSNEKQSCWFFTQWLKENFPWAIVEKDWDYAAVEKMFDIRMLYKWIFYAIECKHFNGKWADDYTKVEKKVEAHQSIYLLKAQKNGWHSYVVAYSWITKSFYIYDFHA